MNGIATMGEEVREPERTIPIAILTALTIVVLIYLVVGVSILIVPGPSRRCRQPGAAGRRRTRGGLGLGQPAGASRCRGRSTRRAAGADRREQNHAGDGASG